jgi:hypothetical protein
MILRCSHRWRLVIYLTTTIVGAYTIWNKDWFWDIKEVWRDYPHQVCNQKYAVHVSTYLYALQTLNLLCFDESRAY